MQTANKQQNKVPELRFSGFSGEWKSKKLGEIADITSSKRVFASDYVEDGIPFFRGKEISELKRNKTASDILYIKESKFNEFKNKFGAPQKGDLLITSVGTLGNTYRVNLDYDFYFKDGNLIWLRGVKEDSRFLERAIDFHKRDLLRGVIGSTQQALTIVEIKKVNISFPRNTEQQKIADFLGSVDDWLDNLRSQKNSLETYKVGCMQKLFTQQIRFKDEDGKDFPEWEKKNLGDIATTTTGESNRDASSEDGEFAFFDRSRDERKSSIYLFDSEAIIVAGEGLDFIPRYFKGKFDLHQRAYAILNEKNDACWLFLSYYLHYHRNYFRKMAVGTTMPSLRLPIFVSMPILLPCVDEQQKIAGFLTSLDKGIESKQQQITKAEEWKKGLMQRMFV